MRECVRGACLCPEQQAQAATQPSTSMRSATHKTTNPNPPDHLTPVHALSHAKTTQCQSRLPSP